jgi:membrane-associated phospholipid phosphatase
VPLRGTPPRRRADVWLALGAGLAYAGLGVLCAGGPPAWERRLFLRVNRTGDSLPALRVPQQLGIPWTLPVTALAALLLGRPRLALAAGLALPVEKALEVGVKKVAGRPRPAQVMYAELHDDAPADGPSYPSGHTAIATCAAMLVTPYLPSGARPYARWAFAAATGLTGCARVHQGAHLPLDVVGGALLGTGAGALLRYMVAPASHG